MARAHKFNLTMADRNAVFFTAIGFGHTFTADTIMKAMKIITPFNRPLGIKRVTFILDCMFNEGYLNRDKQHYWWVSDD